MQHYNKRQNYTTSHIRPSAGWCELRAMPALSFEVDSPARAERRDTQASAAGREEDARSHFSEPKWLHCSSTVGFLAPTRRPVDPSRSRSKSSIEAAWSKISSNAFSHDWAVALPSRSSKATPASWLAFDEVVKLQLPMISLTGVCLFS